MMATHPTIAGLCRGVQWVSPLTPLLGTGDGSGLGPASILGQQAVLTKKSSPGWTLGTWLDHCPAVAYGQGWSLTLSPQVWTPDQSNFKCS